MSARATVPSFTVVIFSSELFHVTALFVASSGLTAAVSLYVIPTSMLAVVLLSATAVTGTPLLYNGKGKRLPTPLFLFALRLPTIETTRPLP